MLSTPVRVTTLGVRQSLGVKVSSDGVTETSLDAPEESCTITGKSGWVPNARLYCRVRDSSTVKGRSYDHTKPGTSSSVLTPRSDRPVSLP